MSFMTAKEFLEWSAGVWARCWWEAKNFDYDLFIDQQMNEGIDPHDGTRYGEEVHL